MELCAERAAKAPGAATNLVNALIVKAGEFMKAATDLEPEVTNKAKALQKLITGLCEAQDVTTQHNVELTEQHAVDISSDRYRRGFTGITLPSGHNGAQ